MKRADLALWGAFVLLLALASLVQERLRPSQPPVASSASKTEKPS